MPLHYPLCCRLCASVWRESSSIWLSGSGDAKGQNKWQIPTTKKKGGSSGRQREKQCKRGEVCKAGKNSTSIFVGDSWTDAERCHCLCECVCERVKGRQTVPVSNMLDSFATKQSDMLSHLPEVHVVVFIVSLFMCMTLRCLSVSSNLCLYQSFTWCTSHCLL